MAAYGLGQPGHQLTGLRRGAKFVRPIWMPVIRRIGVSSFLIFAFIVLMSRRSHTFTNSMESMNISNRNGGHSSHFTPLLAGTDTEVATTGIRFWAEDPLSCIVFLVNMAFVILLINGMASSSETCPAPKTDESLLGLVMFLGTIVVIGAIGSSITVICLSLLRNSIALLCAAVPTATLVGVCAVALALFEPSQILEEHNCSQEASSHWTTGCIGLAVSQFLFVFASGWRRHCLVIKKAHRRPVFARHLQISDDIDENTVNAVRADPNAELKKLVLCALGLFAVFGIPAVFEAIIITVAI